MNYEQKNIWRQNGRLPVTMIHSLFIIALLLFSSHAALAACVTTVTATTPTADFVDHGNGTVTHVKTGLMWKRCSEGQVWNGTTCTGAALTFTWQAGLLQADNLNNGAGFAAFKDWRVPNIKELASIVEGQCSTPAINAAIFPATPLGRYWSASPFAASASSAWSVGFNSGLDGGDGNSNNLYVRLVRGGQ